MKKGSHSGTQSNQDCGIRRIQNKTQRLPNTEILIKSCYQHNETQPCFTLSFVIITLFGFIGNIRSTDTNRLTINAAKLLMDHFLWKWFFFSLLGLFDTSRSIWPTRPIWSRSIKYLIWYQFITKYHPSRNYSVSCNGRF